MDPKLQRLDLKIPSLDLGILDYGLDHPPWIDSQLFILCYDFFDAFQKRNSLVCKSPSHERWPKKLSAQNVDGNKGERIHVSKAIGYTRKNASFIFNKLYRCFQNGCNLLQHFQSLSTIFENNFKVKLLMVTMGKSIKQSPLGQITTPWIFELIIQIYFLTEDRFKYIAKLS